MFEKLELDNSDFEAYVFLDEKNPTKIEIRDKESKKVIIEFNTDAVDCMGFSNISDDEFKKLDEELQKSAANCLAEALKIYYGGKNCLAVPKKLQKIFEDAGFCVLPKMPNGKLYERLMFVRTKDFKNYFSKITSVRKDQLEILSNQYEIIDDKDILVKNSDEISEFFINNAGYASDESKRKGYSSKAIIYRINNEKVHSFAVFDNKKIIGFIRVFIVPDIRLAYVSDLVISAEKQRQGTAILLEQKVFELLQDKADTILLIAGDDKEKEYYAKNLGCKSICNEEEPLNLGNEQIFMFAMIFKKKLLEDFLGSFEMPKSPRKKEQLSEISKLNVMISINGSESATETKSGENNDENNKDFTLTGNLKN